MTLPLLTAVAPRWEVDLAAALSRSEHVHVARRCADVAELLGVAAAGLGRVAVVSCDLRGVDRAVLDTLTAHGLVVLGVHPPDDEAGARTLLRWGCPVVLPADSSPSDLDAALDQLLRGAQPDRASLVDARRRGVDDLSTGDPDSAGGPRPDPPGTDRTGARRQELDEEIEDLLAGVDAEIPREPDGGDRRGQVVVVWGPTGSPGRTTVAVNLAAELADPLHPVLLVDADTYGASVGQQLAVLDEVPGIAAAARSADQGTLDRAALARLAPEAAPGLRVLTGLPRADRWPELRDVALADVLQRGRQLARWTVVDVAPYLEQDEELSFDTLAPRRNGAALTALEAADTVVVVGAGDPVGLQRLVRGLDLLAQVSDAPRVLVVNRVRPGPVGPDPGRRIAEALERFAGVRPAELVPEDRESLDAALLQGRSLRESRPSSPARSALERLADRVGERQAPDGRRAARRRGPRPGRRAASG
jgi:MinD-like ATPase involved in chromosome partitioning or flagellar assembly